MLHHTPCSTDIRQAAGPTRFCCCICNWTASCTRWHMNHCPSADTSHGPAHTAPTRTPCVHAQDEAAAAVTGTRCCHKPHATHTMAQLTGTQKVMPLASYNYQATKAGARAPQPGAPMPCRPHCAVRPLALFFSHTQPLADPSLLPQLPTASPNSRCCCLRASTPCLLPTRWCKQTAAAVCCTPSKQDGRNPGIPLHRKLLDSYSRPTAQPSTQCTACWMLQALLLRQWPLSG